MRRGPGLEPAWPRDTMYNAKLPIYTLHGAQPAAMGATQVQRGQNPSAKCPAGERQGTTRGQNSSRGDEAFPRVSHPLSRRRWAVPAMAAEVTGFQQKDMAARGPRGHNQAVRALPGLSRGPWWRGRPGTPPGSTAGEPPPARPCASPPLHRAQWKRENQRKAFRNEN